MAGNSIEENQRLLAAILEKCVELRHEKEKLLNEPVSPPEAKTLREHCEEIDRLKKKKYGNRAGWSPEQQTELDALLDTPRYANEFSPLDLMWFSAEVRYDRLLEKMERAGQVACSEVTPDPPKVNLKGVAVAKDARAGPSTADISENKPLLSKGAYSSDFSRHQSCSSARQRMISHRVS